MPHSRRYYQGKKGRGRPGCALTTMTSRRRILHSIDAGRQPRRQPASFVAERILLCLHACFVTCASPHVISMIDKGAWRAIVECRALFFKKWHTDVTSGQSTAGCPGLSGTLDDTDSKLIFCTYIFFNVVVMGCLHRGWGRDNLVPSHGRIPRLCVEHRCSSGNRSGAGLWAAPIGLHPAV